MLKQKSYLAKYVVYQYQAWRFPIDLVPFCARAYCTLRQFSARVSSFILRSVVTDMNSKLMLLPRESLFQLAIRHLKKRGGNWAELIFTKTSGIVTSDVSVIYWPIFVPVPSYSPRSLCDRKSYLGPVSLSFLRWRMTWRWGRPTIFLSFDKHLPLFKPSHADAVHVYIVNGWVVIVKLMRKRKYTTLARDARSIEGWGLTSRDKTRSTQKGAAMALKSSAL